MASKFSNIIRRLIQQNNWEPSHLDDQSIEIDIDLEEEGGAFTVFIELDDDNLVEFSVQSLAVFESDDDIPHEASTLLLRRNTELVIGYWTLVDNEDISAYTLMDLEDLDVLDQEGGEYFAGIISDMISEVAEFNEIWEEEDW